MLKRKLKKKRKRRRKKMVKRSHLRKMPNKNRLHHLHLPLLLLPPPPPLPQQLRRNPRRQSRQRGSTENDNRSQSTSNEVANAATATLTTFNEQISERERQQTGFTSGEKQEARAFLKGIGISFGSFLLHPIRFLIQNTWLLHCLLYGFSTFFINPWLVFTRVFAFVGIVQQVMNDGILSLGLQVQYLLVFTQFFNIISILRKN